MAIVAACCTFVNICAHEPRSRKTRVASARERAIAVDTGAMLTTGGRQALVDVEASVASCRPTTIAPALVSLEEVDAGGARVAGRSLALVGLGAVYPISFESGVARALGIANTVLARCIGVTGQGGRGDAFVNLFAV